MSDYEPPVDGEENLPEGNVPADNPPEPPVNKPKRNSLEVLLANYKKDPARHAKDVRAKVTDYKTNTKDEQLPAQWKDFIIDIVGETLQAKDEDLCRFLIDFAQELDDKYARADMKDSTLYESIVQVYPEAIALEDFKKYCAKAAVGEDGFKRCCNRAMEHIRKAEDGKFATKLYDWLKSEGDNEHVQIYLEILLEDKVVAAKVLNQDFFDNRNRVGERFAKSIETFVKKHKKIDLDYENTAVWENWDAVRDAWARRNKKRAITIIVAILLTIIIIAGAGVGFLAWRDSIDTDSVKIEGKGIIYCTYGESPNLDGYTVSYSKHSGEKYTIEVTEDMLTYDKESIGQQTATITYKGTTLSVTVQIDAADIDVPEITQSGNSISWQSIEHASSYYLYVTTSSTAVADTQYTTLETTTYDFSGQSDLSGTFYVYVIAKSASEKYNDSAMSNRLTLIKLATVTTISYADGKITWSAVDGADHYMLTYNGTSVQNIISSSYEVELSGDISISVNAYSSDSSVISSVGSTVTLQRLDAVTSAEYSDDKITWTSSQVCYYSYSVDDGEYSTPALANYVDVSGWTTGVHSITIICSPMYSNQIASAAVTYKFSINSELKVSTAGVVSWSSIGSVYDIYLDGTRTEQSLSTNEFPLSGYSLAAGEHTISIVADGDIYGKTLSFTQLATPSLGVSSDGSELEIEATSYTVYTYNNAVYTLDGLKTLTATAGTYTITVQNVSAEDNVISSGSSTVTITKLAIPTLSVVSGEITGTGNATLQLYENGNRVAVDDLSAGSHTLTAVAISSDSTTLNSEASASITVTKLAAPELSYDEGVLSVVNENTNYTIKYYVDGTEYTGAFANLLSSLESGSHEITARYIGDDTSVISSSLSASQTVFQTDAKLTVTDNGGGYVYVRLQGLEEGLSYDMTIYFYDEYGDEIDSYTWANQTATSQRKSCTRNNGTSQAYSVKVVISFKSGDTTYTLTGETDIAW